MKFTTAKFALACVMVAGLSGCKTSTEGNNLVDKIRINNNKVTFDYVTTFSENVEASIEGDIPVGKYGNISFFNDANGRLNIGLGFSFEIFSDSDLQEVTALPNGARFPAIVTGPMYQMQLNSSGKGNMYILVDKTGTIGQGVKLAGLAWELSSVQNNFPEISITQSFYNDNKQRVASFTLYGPRTVNGVTVPGGLFVVGNINEIIGGKSKLYRGEPNIHGPAASQYKSELAQRDLLKVSERALSNHGIKLHFQ
ncbi:MAG: hypothetical protein HUU57_12340 [Bdellovibrio sp.]|nr:hypothetical protein [Bdellovibrio sp.]